MCILIRLEDTGEHGNLDGIVDVMVDGIVILDMVLCSTRSNFYLWIFLKCKVHETRPAMILEPNKGIGVTRRDNSGYLIASNALYLYQDRSVWKIRLEISLTNAIITSQTAFRFISPDKLAAVFM